MKMDKNQKLNWVSFAIQEALNGNPSELEQALYLVESLRSETLEVYQYDGWFATVEFAEGLGWSGPDDDGDDCVDWGDHVEDAAMDYIRSKGKEICFAQFESRDSCDCSICTPSTKEVVS